MNYDAAIIHLYQTLVGRDPDSAGFQYWSTEMGAGRSTQGDLVAALMRSAEFSSTQDGVIRLYKAAFGRIPDKAGYDYWVEKIDNGEHTLQDVSTLFITSPEFEQRFGPSVLVETVVSKMYQNTFGRDPDTAGFNYWVDQVQNGLTISDLLLNFTESAEGVETLSDYVATVVAYEKLVDRMPTAAEILVASPQLAEVANNVIAAAEYSGPNPAQPDSALETTFVDGSLTVTGTAAGAVRINQRTEELTESGFDLSVTGLDWTAITAVDTSGIDGQIVMLDGADAPLSVTVGDAFHLVTLGAGDDIVILTDLPQESGFVLNGGLGANTLMWSTAQNVDLSGDHGSYQRFSIITGSEYDDMLTLEIDDLDLTIDMSGGTDSIRLVGGGTVNVPTLATVANVERWLFSDSAVYDFIGSENNDHVTVGTGGGRLLGAVGADTFYLSTGADLIAFAAIADSQQDTAEVAFTGDTVHGFDFSEDQFELPVSVDGSITNNVTVASAFHSNLASILAADANVTTALTTDTTPDIDAVLVEVEAGGASGHYLIVQATAKDTAFDATTDLLVKLVGAANTTSFDAVNII